MAATSHPLEPLLRTLQRHSRLSSEDRQAILDLPYTLRTLEASTYTVREGDPPQRCCVLLSGYAYRQKLTGDGARQILAIHMPGDPLDFQNLFLDVSDHSVQMLTRGEVADVPRSAFQQLARSRAAVGHAILVTTLIEASIFREWVLNVGRRDARTRLAHLLCEFALRVETQGLAEENGYQLPMTQEQLADAVGLTSVHVNRTLKALEAEGLILRSKRTINIPNWERMRLVGDFSERYLHLEPQHAGERV
ncbi:MAG TPA: Crp/Fnr family transcriptional regulator [Sphingomonas sp.]|nr:Crp/Fnr family transcriptional regulator [Sphingomonas sp.]